MDTRKDYVETTLPSSYFSPFGVQEFTVASTSLGLMSPAYQLRPYGVGDS